MDVQEIKSTATIIGVALVVVVAIYLVGRFLGKKAAEKEGSKPIQPEDLPNSGSGIPQGWTPSNLSDRLRESIEGWSWRWMWDGNEQLWNELATLATDDMFKAVFLDYQRRYGESLLQNLNDEWVDLLSQMGEIRDRINQRANALGIA
jgi:hypothetical protein